MSRTKRSVTIIDVAKAAGVSVTTVSRVLNGKDDVSAETAERVRTVIEDLNYSSSLAARGMRSRKTNVIGLIMPDVEGAFAVQVMRGVNRAILELDCSLLVYTNGDFRRNASAAKERQYVSLLNSGVTDGVVIVTPTSPGFSSVAPVVSVDPNVSYGSGPAVISTNFEGAYEATQHLIALNHTRIGFIGGRVDLLSAQQRREAFTQAMQAAGLPVDPQIVIDGDYTTETAARCTHHLLSLASPPTAIFAANDQSAIGVLEAAASRGVRVPEDLSVAGFDNIPEAAYLNLTTVDQFLNQMGYLGTNMLFDLIHGQPLDEEVITIETRLVLRGSTAERR